VTVDSLEQGAPARGISKIPANIATWNYTHFGHTATATVECEGEVSLRRGLAQREQRHYDA